MVRFTFSLISIVVCVLLGISVFSSGARSIRFTEELPPQQVTTMSLTQPKPALEDDITTQETALPIQEITQGWIYGVDISSYTKAVTPETWKLMKQDGWSFAIASVWQGRRTNRYAAQQLASARQSGLKTAAYCLLNFDDPKQTGDWQVRQGLAALGSEPISFLAIDVEIPGPNFQFKVDATKRIKEAVQATLDAGLKPVIYTKKGDWKRITRSKEEPEGTEQFKDIPLWGLCWDDQPNLKNDKFVPTSPFGGWEKRIGKQYSDDKNLWTQELQFRYHIGAIDLNVFEQDPFATAVCVNTPKSSPAQSAATESNSSTTEATTICF